MKKLTKIVTGAAAGLGLLALMFTGRGDSEEPQESAEARAHAPDDDQAASVRGRAERSPEGSAVTSDLIDEIDGTDLFVG